MYSFAFQRYVVYTFIYGKHNTRHRYVVLSKKFQILITQTSVKILQNSMRYGNLKNNTEKDCDILLLFVKYSPCQKMPRVFELKSVQSVLQMRQLEDRRGTSSHIFPTTHSFYPQLWQTPNDNNRIRNSYICVRVNIHRVFILRITNSSGSLRSTAVSTWQPVFWHFWHLHYSFTTETFYTVHIMCTWEQQALTN
jgi:hypothetical protein